MTIHRKIFLNGKFDELIFTPPQGRRNGSIFFDYPCDVMPYSGDHEHAMYARRVAKLNTFEAKVRGPYHLYSEDHRSQILPDFVSFVITPEVTDMKLLHTADTLDEMFKFIINQHIKPVTTMGEYNDIKNKLWEGANKVALEARAKALIDKPLDTTVRIKPARTIPLPVLTVKAVPEIDVNISRFLNGAWLNVGKSDNSMYFIYMAGSDPLRVSGRPGFDIDTTTDLFKEFIRGAESIDTFYVHMTHFKSERHLGISTKLLPGSDDDYGPFKTVGEAITFVIDNMNEGGRIVTGENKPATLVIEDKWNLGKETYTKAEVIEIMEMMKAEMMESTGQLFDRMLGRITTNKKE